MALELGDPTSGFRHTGVMRFINSEIRSNGGGPDFYLSFYSRSWNEIEDGLHSILTDQQMPRALKKACTWSALALGVRVVGSQQEQQAHQLHSLQEQIEEREAACRALVFEMRRMREERDELRAQLNLARASLEQALNQREMLRERLLQAERSASADSVPQELGSDPGTEQHETAAWFLDQTQAAATTAQGMPHLGIQMPVPEASHYVQGPPGPWAQPMPPPLLMPGPYQFPSHGPFSMGFPYSAPPPSLVVRESAAPAAAATAAAAPMAADVPQMPPEETYQPVLGDHSFQDRCYEGNSRSHSRKKNFQCPPRMTSLVSNQCRRKGPEGLKETDTLGGSSSHSQKGELTVLQGMAPQGIRKIQSVTQNPKKQQQKAKQPHGEKASESPKQEQCASLYSPVNWVCSQCKAVNLPCHGACHKCQKIHMPLGNGGFDPGQTQ